jgi:hypothetical protein
MSFEVKCEACGMIQDAPEKVRGLRVNCRQCKTTFVANEYVKQFTKKPILNLSKEPFNGGCILLVIWFGCWLLWAMTTHSQERMGGGSATSEMGAAFWLGFAVLSAATVVISEIRRHANKP